MSLSEIWGIITNNKGAVVIAILLLLSLVEISKIKLNPWSWLVKGIRSVIGIKDLNTKIEQIETAIEENQKETNDKIDKLENRVDEGQAIQARVRILRYGDDVRRKERHTKDSFDQVMDDITRYHAYCRQHPEFPNDKTVLTTKVIEEEYQRCLRENDFL